MSLRVCNPTPCTYLLIPGFEDILSCVETRNEPYRSENPHECLSYFLSASRPFWASRSFWIMASRIAFPFLNSLVIHCTYVSKAFETGTRTPGRYTSETVAELKVHARSSPSLLDDAVASWLLCGCRRGVARGLAARGLIGLLGIV